MTSVRKLWLLVGVVALGGFQCPQSVPPLPATVQCKQSSAGVKTSETVTWGADSLVQTTPTAFTPGVPISTVLTIRGDSYLSIDVTIGSGSKRTATVHFGKAFSGMREMVLTTIDGETFSGTLDGKQLKPFAQKVGSGTFVDGSTLPAVSIDDRVQQELTAFAKAAKDVPDLCKPKAASSNRPLYADAVPGRLFERLLTIPCQTALEGCREAATVCVIATIFSCQASAYYVPVCVALGIIACIVSTYGVCLPAVLYSKPGPCCPTECGVGCCDFGEACLDPSVGTCCPGDHPQTCAKKVCCSAAPADQCIPDTAICCPQGQTCDCGHLNKQCCPGNFCVPNSGIGCDLTTNKCVSCSAQPPTNTLIATVLHQGNNLLGNDNLYVCQNGACVCTTCPCPNRSLCSPLPPPPACTKGYHQGLCQVSQSTYNGSVCTAKWADAQSCSCIVEIVTPEDLVKSVDCGVVVTETQGPVGCPFCHPGPQVNFNSVPAGGCGVQSSGQCNTNFCWAVPGQCDYGTANGVTNVVVNGSCNGALMASSGPTRVDNNGGQVVAYFSKPQDACYPPGCPLAISFNVNCCQ